MKNNFNTGTALELSVENLQRGNVESTAIQDLHWTVSRKFEAG